MRIIKRNSLVFWFLLVLFYFVLNSCKGPKSLTENSVSNTLDTIYGGYVKSVVYFEKSKTFSSTFIITDSITLSIASKHEIPQNVKCYVYIYNNKRTSTVFTWEGEEKTYKILTE